MHVRVVSSNGCDQQGLVPLAGHEPGSAGAAKPPDLAMALVAARTEYSGQQLIQPPGALVLAEQSSGWQLIQHPGCPANSKMEALVEALEAVAGQAGVPAEVAVP